MDNSNFQPPTSKCKVHTFVVPSSLGDLHPAQLRSYYCRLVRKGFLVEFNTETTAHSNDNQGVPDSTTSGG
ncbi:hypothetical protein Y032_0884g2852 [Ancylostoma ceylanicum]|uniref:Uncharacterized protein n=1 Tax=Ancylostoma ceylanicum TaxID=53326 RepID=A0A016WC58_9BILA|nr:hypothetical protein Y032_0884g2852 [Ancylostoma ceylanicum]